MNLPTGIVAFLFTDIEGSTRLWESHPNAMRAAHALHDKIMYDAAESYGGYVFKTAGDSFQVVFAYAPDAVAAALHAQRALAHAKWGETGPLRVRMAIHLGPAERQGDDYLTTPTLNRLARLLTAGHGGQVLLSETVEPVLRSVLPPRASLLDLGVHHLRELTGTERIFQLVHPDLRLDFPPLNSVDAFPNNLPLALNRFIGREREIAQVLTLLDSPATHLVTLTGPGGAGKTRLAIQVAVQALDHFPDGVWLIELAGLTDPAFIVPKIAAVLGVREERERPFVETLGTYLHARQCLLVLDNCEHLITACAQVVEQLLSHAANLKIMATSQELLRVAGEHVYPVPSLSLPPAQAQLDFAAAQKSEALLLFADRASKSTPLFALTEHNAPTVAQICHRLDGIPLAIELAAARLNVLTLEQIAARLDDRFRLLTAGSRTALPRQQTLRATMDWSYDLCTDKEKKLWRRLAVFARGFTLEAAEAVTSDDEIPRAEILDELVALVERSVVVRDDNLKVPRYRLLATIQEYGRYHLVEAGEAVTLRDRHRDYFVALAERAEPQLRRTDQVLWLDRLDAEFDNLLAAMEWSCERGQGDQALRIGGALSIFWLMRAHLGEGQVWLTKALAMSGAQTLARGKALNALGNIHYTRGIYAAAELAYRQALDLRRSLGDWEGVARALNNLGSIANVQGDFARAKKHFEDALSYEDKIPDQPLVAVLLSNLGVATMRLGESAQAQAFYQRALDLQRALGDRWGVSFSYSNLAEVAVYERDWTRAQHYYEQCLAVRRELNDRLGVATALLGAAHAALHLNERPRARAELRDSLATLRALGDKQMLAGGLQMFAELLAQEGTPASLERATRLLHAVLVLRQVLGAPLDPLQRAEFEATREQCRSALDVNTFNAAWEQGRLLTVDAAVQMVLTQTGEDAGEGANG